MVTVGSGPGLVEEMELGLIDRIADHLEECQAQAVGLGRASEGSLNPQIIRVGVFKPPALMAE
jgi:hypothetical protein